MSQKPSQSVKSSWLLTVIKFGLYAVLFMPLIISGDFIFPYIFPKQAFFQIVVEILFGLYLFLALKEPSYRPRSSWLLRAILIYFCLLILSSILGLSTYHSFWSNYERMAGVIALWHYFAFLIIAVNIFKTKEDWYRFFDISIIAGVLEAIYGAAQWAGLIQSTGGTRLDGTIGNASFLAGYMLFNALFAFWLYLEKREINWRIFYGGAILLNIFVLYETETRGAVLALIFGLLALGLFFIFVPSRPAGQLPFKNFQRYKKYIIAFLVLFFLVTGLVWVFRNSDFVKSQPTISRLASISFEEATSQTRLLAWRMSFKGFFEHPLFGWGPENYYILFNKYYDPHLYPMENWFDRAHNAFIDVLINTGIVGFIAYGAIFILTFWYLWRAWKKEWINYQTAVIFSVIIIVYGIQNFFVFDTQVTLLMFYSILAFMVFLSLGINEQKIGQPVKANYFLIVLITAVVLSSVYFFNLKPALAGNRGIQALLYVRSGQFKEAAAEFKSAYELGTFGLPEVAQRVYDTAMQMLNGRPEISDSDKKEMVDTAVEGLKKSLEMEPLNARYMMMLGNLYLAATQLDKSYLTEADFVLSQALELSPTRQELYFSLGQLRIFQGRNSEVLPLFKRAVELNDGVYLPHWNYGIMAIALDQKTLGEAEVKKAIELGHSFGPADIQRLINVYTRTNDWPKIIFLYEEWIKQTPNDAAPYAGLAAAYAQAGDKQKAKENALKAAEIDSSFRAEAEQFIKNLGL